MSSALIAGTGEKSAKSLSIDGIWISKQEIANIPMTGPAWQALDKEAKKLLNNPNISDQDDRTDIQVLAKSLVFARTGNNIYREQVIDACMAVIGTEQGGLTLALGRQLISYIIAADLVVLPEAKNIIFKTWLRQMLTLQLQGRTLRSTHEDRPNNWGTHAGASRVAIALYLQDAQELHDAALVFKGYLGDRSAYKAFKFGKLHWQSKPTEPVAINPKGAKINGHNVDGVLPDEQRRCCDNFTWPAPYENYVFEGLQGALAQAMLLDRAGYDVWQWEDKALLRAFTWLYDVAGYQAKGDDTWQPYVINHFYNVNLPVVVPSKPGKGIGFTDWIY